MKLLKLIHNKLAIAKKTQIKRGKKTNKTILQNSTRTHLTREHDSRNLLTLTMT